MIEQQLLKISKDIEGNFLGIGIDNVDLYNEINNNDKIKGCEFLDSYLDSKSNKRGFKKTIAVNKIKKRYKKKRVNYIIANVDSIDKYLKTFIRDSIYITRNIIYIYTNNLNYHNDKFNNYKRYNIKMNVKKYQNGFLIKIETKQAYNNYFKDKIYYIYDTFVNIINIITDILIN